MVCRFRGELLGVEVFGKGLPTLEIIIGGRCCLGIEEVGFFFLLDIMGMMCIMIVRVCYKLRVILHNVLYFVSYTVLYSTCARG